MSRADIFRNFTPLFEHETFRHLSGSWDVCAAWNKVQSWTNAERLAHFEMVRAYDPIDIKINTTRAASDDIDLTIPVLRISGINRNGSTWQRTIDGHHRLYKAAHAGVPALPAFVFTPDESRALEFLKLPSSREINAALRNPSRTVYGIRYDGGKVRIFEYRYGKLRGYSPAIPPPPGKAAEGCTGSGVWVTLKTVEVE